MGEANHHKNARSILAFLVIALFVLSIPQMAYPNQASGQYGQLTDLQSGLGPSYDPAGPTRPISEFAAGTRSGISISLPGSPNAYVDIDSGWVGNAATAYIYNLWDRRNWVRNGTFNVGSGSPPRSSPPWNYYELDPTGYDDGQWTSTLPQAGKNCVWTSLPHPGGFYRTYTYGEYSAWNQTFTVPRGTVTEARLSLNYYPTGLTGVSGGEFRFYVRIEGHIVYEIDFQTLQTQGRVDKWTAIANYNVLTDVNGSSVFSLPSDQNIQVSIGVRYWAPTRQYNFPNTPNRVYFDNVTLVLQAYAKPHQIDLKVRPQGTSNATVSDSGPWGNGTATMTGFSTSGTSFPFIFSSANLTSANTAGLSCIIRLSATRSSYATSVFQSQGSGDEISWTFKYQTWFSSGNQPIGSGPTYYMKYYFNITVPSDYTFTTCKDPGGKTHDINTEANFTKFTVGSDLVLRVNVTSIGSYTSGSNPPPDGPYAPYQINAQSDNYVKQVWTQLQSGSDWVNETNLYPKQNVKFAAYITSGSTPVSGGLANLTIRGPPTYGASPVVIETINSVPAVNGFANFTKTPLPISYVAGNYSATVDWLNKTVGEGGSLTCYFNVTHKFNLYISWPADQDVVLANHKIDTPPTSAKVLDYYTNETLTATVNGRASWESAGRWDSFSYSAIYDAYTNQTTVPDLAPDTSATITVNASKPFYDDATTTNTIYIGKETVCAPSSQSFTVRYTEDQANFKLASVVYQYAPPNNTLITNAGLTLLADISSNNSQIQWSFKCELDLTQNGTGTYRAKIYMFSQIGGGIPAGHTYDVWFRLNKGIHTQTQTFKVQITVLDQPTQMFIWSGDNDKTCFWGEKVEFKLNFTTKLAGSWDWPTTTWVYNDSYYVPPYISVITDWGYSWQITPWPFHRGTYNFTIDTSLFPTPTPDGSGQGTRQINIMFHKANFVDPDGKVLTIHIKSLTTSMTAVGGTTTSVWSATPKTILFWYNDTHIGNFGISGATVTYTSSSGNALGSGSLTAVVGSAGLYNLTLSSDLTNKLPATYYLYVNASKGNYYIKQSITVTLDIQAIPTVLQVISPTTSAYYLERVVYLMWLNDTLGNPLSGALMTVLTIPSMTIVSPYETSTPGLYNLTIPSGAATGQYSIRIYSSKAMYAPGNQTLTLDINRLPTIFVSYTLSDGVKLVQPNATIPQGDSLTIYLWFNDTYNGEPVTEAWQWITFQSPEFGNGMASEVVGTPGLYRITLLPAENAGIFGITIYENVPGYVSHQIDFQVTVQAPPPPPPGFNILQVMMVGLGGGGIVVVGAVAWILMRRARIPFVVKKINETLAIINKGEHEQAKPVPLRSREETIAAITQERIDAFTKRKPFAGPPTGPPSKAGPGEVTAAAPSVEAALTQELKKVEGEEKPEEGIEEVEMDTLDQELGRLEGVESKEQLPEGAKEVRDVIEKYKAGKKKKEK